MKLLRRQSKTTNVVFLVIEGEAVGTSPDSHLHDRFYKWKGLLLALNGSKFREKRSCRGSCTVARLLLFIVFGEVELPVI